MNNLIILGKIILESNFDMIVFLQRIFGNVELAFCKFFVLYPLTV